MDVNRIRILSASLLSLSIFSPAYAVVTINFDDAIVGATSYSFDADNDNEPDVIFSTSDPSGFNTTGPGSNMTYIQEPGLEGTTRLNPDLRVDFTSTALNNLSFGYAENVFSDHTAGVVFSVYDRNDNLLSSVNSTAYVHTGSFAENWVETSFDGRASYATFNFYGDSTRYIIDNFSGTYGTTEIIPERSRPDLNQVIDKITGAKDISDAGFFIEDHSLWGQGDFLDFDKTLGVSTSFDSNVSLGSIVEVGVDISGEVEAGLRATLEGTSGDLDISLVTSLATDYKITEDGRLQLTPNYSINDVAMEAAASDISFSLSQYLDYRSTMSAYIDVLGFPEYELSESQFSNNYSEEIIGIDSIYLPSLADLSYCVAGSGSDCLINSFGLGEVTLNYPSGRPSDYSDELTPNGTIEANLRTNDLFTAEIDLDALLLTLGTGSSAALSTRLATEEYLNRIPGVNIELLGYDLLSPSFGIDALGTGVEFGLTIIDFDFGADLFLNSDLVFEPNLTATYTIDGVTKTAYSGESVFFDIATQNDINITSSYSMDNSIFSNTFGLRGEVGFEMEAGGLSASGSIAGFEGQIGVTAFEKDFGNILEGDLLSNEWRFDFINDDHGFNEIHDNWIIDSYSVIGHSLSDIADSSLPHSTLSNDENWFVDGTAYFEQDGEIVLKTNSPTLVYADISVPIDAQWFSVDYLGVDINPNDIFSILFDDDIIFQITGDMILDEWMRTELLDISNYSGLDVLLSIILLSPEDVHSEIWIDNISFYNEDAQIVLRSEVPTPAPLVLIAIGLIALGVTQRSKRVVH